MSRWWNTHRFDVLETALITGFAGLCVWAYVAQGGPSPELDQLRATYGPDRYSEHEEEWIIRDFFRDKRNGFFVDVGANHYRRFSNTFYLEEHLDWSGIAIDPQREFEEDYTKYRRRTRFFAFFVSDVSDQKVNVYVQEANKLVTSADRSFTQRWGGTVKEMTAPTIALTDLLNHQNVSRIDLLSMDIELAEPKALAGFDIDRFRPALACVEAHAEVRQLILDYFARHGYVVLGKYLWADARNLYFRPLESTPAQ